MTAGKIADRANAVAVQASDKPDNFTQQQLNESESSSKTKSKPAGIRADESEEKLRCILSDEADRLRSLFHEAREKIETLLPENARLKASIDSAKAVHWLAPTLPIFGAAVSGIVSIFAKQGEFWFVAGHVTGVVVTLIGCGLVFLHQCLGWPAGK